MRALVLVLCVFGGLLLVHPAPAISQDKDAGSDTGIDMDALNKALDNYCRGNAKCWVEERYEMVRSICGFNLEKLAERKATYGYRLADDFLESAFSVYKWRDEDAEVVTVIGDRIALQMGGGLWQQNIYTCVLDIPNKKVLDLRMEPGKL